MVNGPYIPANIDKILGSKKKRIGVWQRKSKSEIKAVQEQIKKSSNSLVMPIGVSLISGFTYYMTMNMISHSNLSYCMASAIIAYFTQFKVLSEEFNPQNILSITIMSYRGAQSKSNGSTSK
jgi:invasion protein IalB